MEPILEYRGEFKKGRLGAKKYPLRLALYPSHIEGEGFWIEGSGDLSQYTISININMPQIRKVTEVEINGETALQIEYMKYQAYDGTKEYVIVLGIQNCDEWISAISRTKEEYFENERKEKDLAYKKRLAEKEAAAEAARKAEEEARLAAEAAARKAEEEARLAAAEAARKAEEEARLAAEEALRAEEEAKARAEAEAKAAAAAKAREEAELQARAEAEAARAREAAAAAKAAEEAKMAEERALEELAAKALAQAEEAARAAKADENITAASQEETVSEPMTHMGEEEAEMSDEKITVDEFKEKLDKLMLLKDAGILSEAEFSAEKAKLISLM